VARRTTRQPIPDPGVGVGGGELIALHQSRRECLGRGVEKGLGQSETEGDDVDDPDPDVAAPDSPGQQTHSHGTDRVGDDHHPAPIHPVDESTRDQSEEKPGKTAHQCRSGYQQGITAQRCHQKWKGGAHYPVADVGYPGGERKLVEARSESCRHVGQHYRR
jgi:hypothetical protein